MTYKKIKRYINILLNEGTKWEYKEILEKESEKITISEIKKLSIRKRFYLGSFSIFLSFFISAGFSSDFIGYITAALTIFIGLFTNLIIVIYQRFTSLPQRIENIDQVPDDLKQINLLKIKDFIRQFSFVTGKNLMIGTIIVILLVFTLLFKSYFSTNTANFTFIKSYDEITKDTLVHFGIYSSLLIYRTILIYLLADFFLLLMYSLGALFAFLKGEYS